MPRKRKTPDAGGKGMIVVRGVVRLGGRAALHGFVGGPVGEQISAGCRELGVEDRHVRIDGETRVSTVLVDSATGSSTVEMLRSSSLRMPRAVYRLTVLPEPVGPVTSTMP